MFGDRLTKLRKEKKMTQEEVSRRIGVARTSYASYEQNRRVPDSDVQNKIADLFNVSLDFLHGRTEKNAIFDDSDLVAAHSNIDLKDMTDEQLEEIDRFVEYVRKRDNL